MTAASQLNTSAPARSSLHAMARRFAEAGIKVFPCLVDAKQPATPNGFHDASADVAQIDAWWGENPTYNIGLCPEDAGWCVVDIDPGGEATWVEALDDGGYPPTYEVQTPRGGRHLYFAGSLPSTASKLAAHVDTRGVGGYVLVPPSVANGKPYEVLYDREIAPVPGWIAPRLAKNNKHVDVGDKPIDTDIAVARATGHVRSLVSGGDVAIQGHGGDARTVALFALLKDLGVSGDTALRIVVDEGWNAACVPPWELTELAVKRDNGFRYAQNSAGSATDTRSAEEVFGKSEAFQLAVAKGAAKEQDNEPEDEPEAGDESWRELVARFRGFTPAEGAALPEISFFDTNKLYPRTMDGAVGIMFGPYGGGKSALAVSDLMRMIRAHLDDPEHVKPVRVAYGVGEGRHGVLKNRVPAVAKALGIDLNTLRMFWRTVPVPNLTIKRHVKAFIFALSNLFDGQQPDIVVIDTLHSSSGDIDENSDAIGKLLTSNGPIGRIKERLGGLMVLVIDHTGKDVSKGARGSSSKGGDADFLIEVRFDKDARRITAWLEKQKDGDDHYEVEYSVTPAGQVPVATPIGRVDAQQTAARKQATSLARSVLNCLSWLSEWKHGQKGEVSTGELATALIRSKAWTDPEAPGAAAPEIVLGAALNNDETAARRVVQINITRLARQWSKHPEYKHLVGKDAHSPDWTFKAHAAARLQNALASERRE